MIGAHTARALVDLGRDVVVTSHRRAEVPSFLAGRVTVERLDVTDRDAFLVLGERHRISDIIHLAGTVPGQDPVRFLRADAPTTSPAADRSPTASSLRPCRRPFPVPGPTCCPGDRSAPATTPTSTPPGSPPTPPTPASRLPPG